MIRVTYESVSIEDAVLAMQHLLSFSGVTDFTTFYMNTSLIVDVVYTKQPALYSDKYNVEILTNA